MNWWLVYFVVWLSAAVVSVLLTWLARYAGQRFGLVDHPNREQHKRHGTAVSMLGGAAICVTWFAVIGGGFAIAPVFRPVLHPDVAAYLSGLFRALPKLACIGAGGLAMAGLGLADDIRPLSAGRKLLGQVAIAACVSGFGVRATVFIDNPFVTWAVTALWIVFIVNAVNFFDNMDALAAGSALLASLFFLVIAIVREQFFVAVLAAATCGGSAGFLIFNWPPASIFMGDCGSHFLGYMLAVIGTMTTFYSPSHSPTFAPVLIPLLVLALPIFDLFAVVVIRFRHGTPVYVGDHRHISHRFVRSGLSRRAAIVVIHLLGFAIGAGAVSLLWLPVAGAVIVFCQAGALLALVSILHASGPPPGEESASC